MQIHRHVMAKLQQVGETQAWKVGVASAMARRAGQGSTTPYPPRSGKRCRPAFVEGRRPPIRPWRPWPAAKVHGPAPSPSPDGRRDGVDQTAETDDDQFRAALGLATRLVVVVDARPHPLNHMAHGFSGHVEEPLDAEDVEIPGGPFQAGGQRLHVLDGAERQGKTLEVVVTMILAAIVAVVMGRPGGEIAFGGLGEAQQRPGVEFALHRGDDLTPSRTADSRAPQHVSSGSIRSALLKYHVRAVELFLENLRERVFVIKFLSVSLCSRGLGIVGEATGRDGGGIDDGQHAVHGDLGSDLRPVERLDQRLRQGQAEVSTTM